MWQGWGRRQGKYCHQSFSMPLITQIWHQMQRLQPEQKSRIATHAVVQENISETLWFLWVITDSSLYYSETSQWHYLLWDRARELHSGPSWAAAKSLWVPERRCMLLYKSLSSERSPQNSVAERVVSQELPVGWSSCHWILFFLHFFGSVCGEGAAMSTL